MTTWDTTAPSMAWVWIHNVFDTGYKLSRGELMAEEAEAMCVKWILGWKKRTKQWNRKA